MSKAHKEMKAAPKTKPLFDINPWSCIHEPGLSSKIEAYVEGGDWQTIATVQQNAFIDAEKTAEFIAKTVNDWKDLQDLIDEMADVLELCLKCELSWEAEQAAEILIKRARSRNR